MVFVFIGIEVRKRRTPSGIKTAIKVEVSRLGPLGKGGYLTVCQLGADCSLGWRLLDSANLGQTTTGGATLICGLAGPGYK